jgi:hypothetical protein
MCQYAHTICYTSITRPILDRIAYVFTTHLGSIIDEAGLPIRIESTDSFEDKSNSSSSESHNLNQSVISLIPEMKKDTIELKASNEIVLGQDQDVQPIEKKMMPRKPQSQPDQPEQPDPDVLVSPDQGSYKNKLMPDEEFSVTENVLPESHPDPEQAPDQDVQEVSPDQGPNNYDKKYQLRGMRHLSVPSKPHQNQAAQGGHVGQVVWKGPTWRGTEGQPPPPGWKGRQDQVEQNYEQSNYPAWEKEHQRPSWRQDKYNDPNWKEPVPEQKEGNRPKWTTTRPAAAINPEKIKTKDQQNWVESRQQWIEKGQKASSGAAGWKQGLVYLNHASFYATFHIITQPFTNILITQPLFFSRSGRFEGGFTFRFRLVLHQ